MKIAIFTAELETTIFMLYICNDGKATEVIVTIVGVFRQKVQYPFPFCRKKEIYMRMTLLTQFSIECAVCIIINNIVVVAVCLLCFVNSFTYFDVVCFETETFAYFKGIPRLLVYIFLLCDLNAHFA